MKKVIMMKKIKIKIYFFLFIKKKYSMRNFYLYELKGNLYKKN